MKKLYKIILLLALTIITIIPSRTYALSYDSQSYSGQHGYITYIIDPLNGDDMIRFEPNNSYMTANSYGFLSLDFYKDNILLNSYYFTNNEDYILLKPRENSNKIILTVYKIFGEIGMADMESIKANGFSINIPIVLDYSYTANNPTYYYDEGFWAGHDEARVNTIMNIFTNGLLTTASLSQHLLSQQEYNDLVNNYDASYDYLEGYNNGYSTGIQVETDFSLFTQTISFMGGLFAIEIWPNVSIGLLASIPIGLALFKWFLGLFGKGGGGSK